MKIVVLLSLLFVGFGAQDPDHWHSQIMVGEMVVCLWIARVLYTKTHFLAGLAFSYFTCYSVYCCYRTSRFSSPNMDVQSLFDGATARSLLFLVLATTPFIFIKEKYFKDVLSGVKYFALINACYMIFHRFFLHGSSVHVAYTAATGLIGMDSIDGSFLAIMLPFFIFSGNSQREDKHLGILVLLVAMFLTNSSTVFGILCAYVLAFTFYRMKKTLENFILLLLGGAASIPIGRLYLNSDLLNDNGRRHILSLAWQTFQNIGQTTHGWEKFGINIFGLGTSSFLIAAPAVQNSSSVFIWLHNEFAQVLFEQGLVGLLLIASIYFYLLWKQRKNLPMWLMLIGSGATMLLQPCFRYFLFAVPLAFLARLSFENEINFNTEESL